MWLVWGTPNDGVQISMVPLPEETLIVWEGLGKLGNSWERGSYRGPYLRCLDIAEAC